MSKTGSDQSASLLDLTDRDCLHQLMAMRSSLDCHYPVPRTESLVGEHEGEGGMTVGNGDEMWAIRSGELSGSHDCSSCLIKSPGRIVSAFGGLTLLQTLLQLYCHLQNLTAWGY